MSPETTDTFVYESMVFASSLPTAEPVRKPDSETCINVGQTAVARADNTICTTITEHHPKTAIHPYTATV